MKRRKYLRWVLEDNTCPCRSGRKPISRSENNECLKIERHGTEWSVGRTKSSLQWLGRGCEKTWHYCLKNESAQCKLAFKTGELRRKTWTASWNQADLRARPQGDHEDSRDNSILQLGDEIKQVSCTLRAVGFLSLWIWKSKSCRTLAVKSETIVWYSQKQNFPEDALRVY